MNGTVPVEETRVEDLAHLDFEVRCEWKIGESHAAQQFAVCRFCNRHTAICDLHLAMIRAEFAQFRVRMELAGVPSNTHIIKCVACVGDAPSFDELFIVIPVKP